MHPRVSKIYSKFKGKSFIFFLKDEVGFGSLLDIGCGENSPIKYVVERGYSVGLDTFKPSILKSKRAKLHDDYVLASVSHLCFKPKSFQTAVLVEVLEHLSKSDGYKIIDQIEDLAKNRVLVSTPNGFLKQQEIEGNVNQKHLSGWTVIELENLGFNVYGMNGFRFFLKEQAGYRINQLWYRVLSDLSQILAYRYPMIAFQLLAVKKVNNNHLKNETKTLQIRDIHRFQCFEAFLSMRYVFSC